MGNSVQPRPFADWNEDHGCVLWFFHPITEPPYCGSPTDLGRTMSIEIQIGFEQIELPTRDVGGWPWQQEDEPQLWWVPLPDCNKIHKQIEALIPAHASDCASFLLPVPGPCDCAYPAVTPIDFDEGAVAIEVVLEGLSPAQRKLLARLQPARGSLADDLHFTYRVDTPHGGLQTCHALARRQMVVVSAYDRPTERRDVGHVCLTPLGDLIRKRVKEVANG